MMKILIVYDSAYGNTEKIALAMADAAEATDEAHLSLVSDTSRLDLAMVDLLVMGSPTQGGRPTQAIQDFLANLPSGTLKGIKVASFDTRFAINDHGLGLRMLMKTIGFAAPRILADLREKGGTPICQPEGFKVRVKEGPLNQGELERAIKWMNKAVLAAKEIRTFAASPA